MIHWPWLVLAFVVGALFGFAGLLGLISFVGQLGEGDKRTGAAR